MKVETGMCAWRAWTNDEVFACLVLIFISTISDYSVMKYYICSVIGALILLPGSIHQLNESYMLQMQQSRLWTLRAMIGPRQMPQYETFLCLGTHQMAAPASILTQAVLLCTSELFLRRIWIS